MQLLTKKSTKFFVYIFILFSLFSCSGASPDIVQVIWNLNYEWDSSGNVKELLSFFTHVRDDDGIEDIDSIYLIHDESETYWQIQAEEWEQFNQNGVVWLGSNNIEVFYQEKFPSGDYRVLVVDKKGERSTSSFNLPRFDKQISDYREPKIEWVGTELSYNFFTEIRLLTVWLYDSQKNFIGSKDFIPTADITLEAIMYNSKIKDSARFFKLFAEELSNSTGLITQYYPIN